MDPQRAGHPTVPRIIYGTAVKQIDLNDNVQWDFPASSFTGPCLCLSRSMPECIAARPGGCGRFAGHATGQKLRRHSPLGGNFKWDDERGKAHWDSDKMRRDRTR